MSWKQLLVEGRVQSHKTSKQEIDSLRAVVARDIKDASITNLSADRQFAIAYNAALQLAKMVLAASGYRVTGLGHHQTSFEALEAAMGSAVSKLVSYFDVCRRKRNLLDYDAANIATKTEADELLKKVCEFNELVEKWIQKNHRPLA